MRVLQSQAPRAAMERAPLLATVLRRRFLDKERSSVRVLAGAQLDSALVLWFLTLVMSKRPASHEVQLTVLLVGVCRQAAAARLLQQVFSAARAQAAAAGPVAQVALRVQPSSTLVEPPPAHEALLGAGAPPMAQAAWQQEAPPPADLVWLLAPYFAAEPLDADVQRALAPLAPVEGGLLCLHYADTHCALPLEQQRALWRALPAPTILLDGPLCYVQSLRVSPDERLLQLLAAEPLWQRLLPAGDVDLAALLHVATHLAFRQDLRAVRAEPGVAPRFDDAGTLFAPFGARRDQTLSALRLLAASPETAAALFLA